jgi:hypothetical protein
MAKRKTKKVHHRRRRAVGAAGMADAVTTVLGLTGGALAGAYLTNIARAQFATLPKFAAPAVVVVAGTMVPKFLKSKLGASVGAGMQAVGGLQLISSFIAVPGITGTGVGAVTYPRSVPRIQNPIGAPGFMNTPISGAQDMQTIGKGMGALYDN